MKVKSYCNTAFSHNFIPIINKPTRVTNHNATIIDHILTNTFNRKIDSGILKVDISDHFPIFFTSKAIKIKASKDPVFVMKCDINLFTLSLFKEILLEVDWGFLKTIQDPNEAYKSFLLVFGNLYEIAFPKIKIKVNSKNQLSPWITQGIIKSSKRKRKLYEKFWKNRNSANKENYKTFTRLFESIKQKSKKNYYHNILNTYKNDMKRTWATMKEIIGSKRSSGASFPKRLVVNNFDIFDQMTVAENFNNFFSEIGPKLESKIPYSIISFEHFLQGDYQILEEKPVADDELNEAIKFLKSKKSSGCDEISSDVFKHISPLIFDPLKYIFNLSLEKGIFPDQLKIAKMTLLFKKGDNASMDNYRPISVLPCFSKILERIIYNRFYTFFIENDILCEKQFGFQKQHSTEHAIIHLVNDILKSFDSNKYSLGVFID